MFFCDGDLRNFRKEHIEQLLKPLQRGEMVMSVGLRDYGPIRNFFYKGGFFPLIAGERALPYSIFKQIMDHPLMKGYGLELVLNDYCKKKNIFIYKSIMKGLKETFKPKKWKKGYYFLAIEMLQIFLTLLRLKWGI